MKGEVVALVQISMDIYLHDGGRFGAPVESPQEAVDLINFMQSAKPGDALRIQAFPSSWPTIERRHIERLEIGVTGPVSDPENPRYASRPELDGEPWPEALLNAHVTFDRMNVVGLSDEEMAIYRALTELHDDGWRARTIAERMDGAKALITALKLDERDRRQRDRVVDELATALEGVYVGDVHDPIHGMWRSAKSEGYLEAAGTVRHHYDERDDE